MSACRDAKEGVVVQTTQTPDSISAALPAEVRILPGTQEAVASWVAFSKFESRMGALLKSGQPEETILLVEELLELTKEIETSEFPEVFDRPAVRSRLKVIRTFLLKVQADFHYRKDPGKSMISLAEAYNAWREQLNRAAGFKLDPEIFNK
jgi:hypothetical protein